MTPAQKAGFKVGEWYTMLNEHDRGRSYGRKMPGTRWQLQEDDGSEYPWFIGENENVREALYLTRFLKKNQDTLQEKEMTTTEQAGFKLGVWYTMFNENNNSSSYPAVTGSRWRLVRHMQNGCPRFIDEDGHETSFMMDRFFRKGESTVPARDTLEHLQQGDVLVASGHNYNRVVQGTIGDIVFTADSDDSTIRTDTWHNLAACGWKLKVAEPEVTELTLEEIAQKLNVPVEQLRIKD